MQTMREETFEFVGYKGMKLAAMLKRLGRSLLNG